MKNPELSLENNWGKWEHDWDEIEDHDKAFLNRQKVLSNISPVFAKLVDFEGSDDINEHIRRTSLPKAKVRNAMIIVTIYVIGYEFDLTAWENDIKINEFYQN